MFMMNFLRTSMVIILVSSFTTGCSRISHTGGSNEYMTLATLWVQNSAEYRALCYQVYNVARQSIERYTPAQIRQRKMAIVLDLDETVLDNSPYQGKMITTGLSYHPDTWAEWVRMRRAQAVPGVKEFLDYANERGFEIYYISNRAVRHFNDTYENMVSLGLPVKRENMFLRTTQLGKDNRREQIEKNHEVVLLVGDVMTDFTDLFEDKTTNERHILTDKFQQEFGRRFIILPNPMYGEWERALYGHDLSLSEKEKARRRMRALYSY
jgi:5'-nucleotidase (lipoprotein e(P4) family)